MADDDPFADYKKWLDPVGTAQATADPSFNIAKEEKLNDIARRESGWRNIPNSEGSGAGGYFQIMPGTWQEAKKLAGLPADKFPDAMSADYLTQRQAASALFDKYGEKPWQASAPAGASLMPPPGQQITDSSIPATSPIPTHSLDPSAVATIPPTLQDKAAEASPPIAPGAPKPPTTPEDPFTNYKQWLTPPEQPTIVQRGLTSAGIETEQLINTLHAAGDKLLGNEDGMRDLMSVNKSLDTKLKELQPRYTNIDDVINKGSVGDYIDWLGYNLGEQIPNIGLITLGGGLTKYLATGLTKAVGEGILSKEIAQEAMAKIGRRASMVGAYAVLAAQSTGQIAQEQYQATGTMQPLAAAGFGALAAVPAAFGPGAIASRFGLSENIATDLAENIRGQVMKVIPGFIGRRVGGAVGYGLESGVANTAQAMVMSLARKYVDQNYQLLGQDNVNRILAAAESGTLLGVVTGGVTPTSPHVYDEYIGRQVNKAFGLDPTHKSETVEFTKSDDPRFDKAFPTDTPNQSVNMIMQGFKDHAIGKGSYDDMHPDDKAAFESRTHTIETLNPLATQMADDIKKRMTNQVVKADDGTEFTPVSARVDLKNEKVELTGPNGETATASTRDLPLREMTVKAADKMHERGSPLTTATPDGYTMGRLGETNLTDNWKHNMDKGALQFMYDKNGARLEDIKGNQVNMTTLKPGVAFAKRPSEDYSIPLKTRIAIQRMAKRFMPGAKIIVDNHKFESPINAKQPGWALSAGDGHYIIYIGQSLKHEDMHYAIAHEFGHIAAWYNFAKLSPARRIAIFNEYSNSLKDPTHDGIKAMSANQMSFFSQRAIARGRYDKDYAKGMLSWYDVDEHFAEQFTKALLTKQTGFVDKYFENTASHINQINEAFNAANTDINLQLNPIGTMARWFDDMKNSEPHFANEVMDTLVKSSTENAKALGAQISPADSLIDRFAKAPPFTPENTMLREAPPEAGITPQIAAEADKFSRFTRWMWNTKQRAKMNPWIEPLRRLSQLFDAFNNTRMKWANRANDVLVQQRNLGKERSKMLDTLESTLDKMPYLGANEASRWPNAVEMGIVIRKIGMSREDWQAIKPVYEAKRDMYKQALDQVEKTAMEAAKRIVDPVAQTAKINSISYEISAMRNRPYYPHMRYGDYAIMVRDAATGKKLHYEMFWTQRQAQDAAKSLMSRMPGATYKLSRIPNEARQWIGLPPGLLDQLRTMPDITPEQQDWIDNFRFDMSPENSFAKRMMHRSGLPGYDMNSARSFANYFSSASGHLARLEHGYNIDQAVKDLYKSADVDFPNDLAQHSTRTQMADWASQEAKYVMHPPNEFGAARSFAFQWWLAFNPSTAFVHMMQMPMFTAPYMSKFYGAGGILHMMKAYGDWRQLYRDPSNSTLEPEFMRGQIRAGHEGILTENRGTDLARWADHGTLNRAIQGTRFQHYIMQMGSATSYIMRQVEKNNRLVTLRAAWKAAMENPNNPMVQKLVAENDMQYRQLLSEGERPEVAAAYIAAKDAVQATHFQYTQVARPKWQRGAMNPFTPFMMYKQQALYFFLHNPAGMRALGMLGITSGLAGLPFEEDINGVVKKISEAFGYRFDFNEWVRSVAKEFTNHPELVVHGFGHDGLGMPQLFNLLGIPLSGVDVSRRLGYGEMVPGMAEWTRDQQESFYERFGRAVGASVGGAFEVPIGIANTLSNFSTPMGLSKLLEQPPTAMRGLESMMPSILRNAWQAMRYAQEGGDVSATGGMRTPLDMTDTYGWSAVLERAAGFTPTDISERNEITDTAHQIEAYWKIRQGNLSRMYVQMRMAGDQQGTADALAAIKQFNQDSPLRGVKIKAKELITQLKDQMRNQLLQERGRDRSGAMNLVRPDFPEYQPPGPSTYTPSSPQQPPS